ncbi:MAG: DUF4468 domain-containing protein [Tannerellaceae bacterium]|nr:DUF4468 domain-containing protein [Tannerellaceae bacterium]
MKHLLWLLLFIPVYVWGQDSRDTSYLEGAVPEVDGKVVFTKEFQIPTFTKEKIYDLVLQWAEEKFNETKKRVVYRNPEEGTIGITGEDYLIFTSTAISLDRSLMNYTIQIVCKDEYCTLSFSRIRYEYDVTHQRTGEKYTAEQWITDQHALTKGKLNRANGKFRAKTIDFVNDLEKDLSAYIGRQALHLSRESLQSQPASVMQEKPVTINQETLQSTKAISEPEMTGELEGYTSITPEKMPGNIIKLLSEDWMLVTAGDETVFNMMTASWGGLGYVLGKPVSYCFIHPARYTYQLIEKSDTYTLTFYTEAYREILQYCGTHSGKSEDKIAASGLTPVSTPEGSKAFKEAWMIIECRKLLSQDLQVDAIHNETVQEEWKDKPFHKMYIGEIINVWIK